MRSLSAECVCVCLVVLIEKPTPTHPVDGWVWLGAWWERKLIIVWTLTGDHL